MKNIVIFTGSGISAESGIPTFRSGVDGLWNNHRIEDICTHEAMEWNRDAVIDFYNDLRRQMFSKEPNAAHRAIASLEKDPRYKVTVITQNVDDLHERAGTKNIVHLHGELRKLRSSINETATVDLEGWKQDPEARHPDGSLLRPFIVFFGESVPNYSLALDIVRRADVLLVVGTSLQVYPAAGLAYAAPENAQIYLVDPADMDLSAMKGNVKHIKKPASTGVIEAIKLITEKM
ncbi:MAG TPA: NAD-dependent protein deacylase [Bacteroidales bacterium]|nr:NAD-dependent protein deacylase [Bacteroidales bacterium]